MEPYWVFEYKMDLNGVKIHNVSLYKYSQRCIVLVTTPSFGKAFSKDFKELNGRFNNRLKINENQISGWIFRADNNSQAKLNALLKEIHSGDVVPEFSGIQEPIFDEKTRNNKIFNLMNNILELASDETEDWVLTDNETAKTSIYFNADEATVTEGDCIYSFQGAHKKIEIYQLQY